MKGIIFNLLEAAVTDAHGEDMWDDLLDATGLDGSYSGVGQYDDAELKALVGAASDALGTGPGEVNKWFGVSAIPMLRETYPAFFDDHADLRLFLLSLNDIIHAEVRKLHPGADVPDFDVEEHDDGALRMRYRSKRKLCRLAEGFIDGAAREYGTTATVVQPACMLDGDDYCDLIVTIH